MHSPSERFCVVVLHPPLQIVAEGGYVAGRRNLVRAAANRLGAPGVAGGATLGQNQNLYQVREVLATRTV